LAGISADTCRAGRKKRINIKTINPQKNVRMVFFMLLYYPSQVYRNVKQ
jgi:hypothetical protein